MSRFLFIVLAALLPASAMAAAPASFSAAPTVTASSDAPGNSYALGTTVVLTAPVAGDFSALGGTVITAAPVSGDDIILAGSVSSRAHVNGDLRAIGGSVDIGAPVAGDLVAAGLSVTNHVSAGGHTFVAAANATVSGGAGGPVTIYANNVALGGVFKGDVTVLASGHVSLAPDTRIAGKLSYEAPEPATIPSTVQIAGGVAYKSASYLPNVGASRALALVSLGLFLIARIIGALILAGMLAGLFPTFARTFTDRVFGRSVRSTLLALLLGFGIVVATPVVILLLALTFVGASIALLIFFLYALLLMLGLMYAGIGVGSYLARRFFGRERVLWHDGVLGMAVFSLVALVPFIGFPIVALGMLLAVGVLLQIFFHVAFPGDSAR